MIENKFKITKSIVNIPLRNVNNYCEITGTELDVKNEEIILFEYYDKEQPRIHKESEDKSKEKWGIKDDY